MTQVAAPRRGDARRDRPLHGVHRLEDRPRPDGPRARARASGLVARLARDHGGSVWPMAWRWQRLLAARGVHDSLARLVRTYFVGYAAGQVLPTSLGGDASRIYETMRRHEGAGGTAAGTVLLERALGGTATLVLAAAGFALAVGHYDLGGYLWVELAFVVGALAPACSSSRPGCTGCCSARGRCCARCASSGRCARSISRCTRSAHPRLLVEMFALTLVVQSVRVLAIWCAGKAVGVDLSPRPYYVMGPLLFLVMLVPFTVNGLAVRESFFVSFLGTLGIAADPAFATGFLFFVVTIALALPGAGDRRGRGEAPVAAKRCKTSRPSSSRTTRCPGSSSASRACAGTTRSWSTTARATARLRSSASDSPTCASSKRRTAASPSAGTPASRTRAAVRPPAQLGRVAARGRARRSRRVRGRAAAGGRRRAAAAQHRRDAAALRARLPDALAARDRVLLPAQARAALPDAERVLRRRLRARRGARGGVSDGRRAARAARRDRRGRAGGRRVLPLQRGDRLVLPLPQAGWKVLFFPGAEATHVYGASHKGQLFVEQVKGHLRFLRKHHGERYARARGG